MILGWAICDLIQINISIETYPDIHTPIKSASIVCAGIYQMIHAIFIFKFVQKQLNDPCATLFEFKVLFLVLVMLATNLMVIAYLGSEYISDMDKKKIGRNGLQ